MFHRVSALTEMSNGKGRTCPFPSRAVLQRVFEVRLHQHSSSESARKLTASAVLSLHVSLRPQPCWLCEPRRAARSMCWLPPPRGWTPTRVRAWRTSRRWWRRSAWRRRRRRPRYKHMHCALWVPPCSGVVHKWPLKPSRKLHASCQSAVAPAILARVCSEAIVHTDSGPLVADSGDSLFRS